MCLIIVHTYLSFRVKINGQCVRCAFDMSVMSVKSDIIFYIALD